MKANDGLTQEVLTIEDIPQRLVPLNHIAMCFAEHERKTGKKPCELILDSQFLLLDGCRIKFHDEPYTLTFDGEKVVQHQAAETYWEMIK